MLLHLVRIASRAPGNEVYEGAMPMQPVVTKCNVSRACVCTREREREAVVCVRETAHV